jgi:hypothetical protein
MDPKALPSHTEAAKVADILWHNFRPQFREYSQNFSQGIVNQELANPEKPIIVWATYPSYSIWENSTKVRGIRQIQLRAFNFPQAIIDSTINSIRTANILFTELVGPAKYAWRKYTYNPSPNAIRDLDAWLKDGNGFIPPLPRLHNNCLLIYYRSQPGVKVPEFHVPANY